MTDIVERLRSWSAMGIAQRGSTVLTEAADQIEQLRYAVRLMRETAVPRDEYELLRGEIERLRAALTHTQWSIITEAIQRHSDGILDEASRTALGEAKDE